MSYFDYLQTFYVNPDSVNGALEVNLSSVELFFKAKPSTNANISGIANPGVSVWICDVSNNQPNPDRIINNKVVYIPYDEINTAGNASSATQVAFPNAIPLKVGKFYGIVIKFDDPGFRIWQNRQGDRLVNEAGPTNNPSPGAQSRFDGTLYRSTNSNEFIPLSDSDLKFKIKIAQYISTSGTFAIANRPYEFFTIDNTTGALLGGELVWQEKANEPGTINVRVNSANVIGTGTSFEQYFSGDKLVIQQGGVTDIVEILNVANDTFIELTTRPAFSNTAITFKRPPVGKVYFTDYTQDQVILTDSNAANSTFKFVTGAKIYGERSNASANVVSLDKYKIDSFTPQFTVDNPSRSEFTAQYAMANSTNGISTFRNLTLLQENTRLEESYLLSRSLEVDAGGLFGTSKRSAVINVSFNVVTSNNNLFTAPRINANELDFFIYQNEINGKADTFETRYGLLDFDTEVEKNGLATSKAILTKITFNENRAAEDLRVFTTAYRPAGTEIGIYAKIHNSADKEAFDDKQWTPLELKDNIDKFSNENTNDLVEYTYGFPQFPESYENLLGEFTVETSNNIVLASNDPSANVVTGDTVKIYDPLIPENHEVFVVESANSTSITVNKPITNINLVGNMYVDKLKYKNVAWNNIANDNVVRYINSSSVEFDTYDTIQLKIVFYSDSTYNVPRMEQIQAIGVSA